ncbi:MAG: hypothetical protein Kow00121_41230 [Elainellaceae cyanobacterium]
MDNAGLPQASEELPVSSERLSEFSAAPVNDIPEAVREGEGEFAPSARRKVVWFGVGGVGAIALLAIPLFFASNNQSFTPSSPSSSTATEPGTDTETASIQASPSPSTVESEQLLGHLSYEEAPQAELVPVSDSGAILLREAAAEKYLEMAAAAQADGIRLTPLSGFRSQEDQEAIFFEVKEERGQRTDTRAEVSAPPGHSEHHTGYAIDIGDSYYPDTDLSVSFEKTPAFEWLQKNAGYYSFELSFPEGNAQGVSYEPWHWRFVGDRDSLETFYRARSQTPPSALESNSPSASDADTDQSAE